MLAASRVQSLRLHPEAPTPPVKAMGWAALAFSSNAGVGNSYILFLAPTNANLLKSLPYNSAPRVDTNAAKSIRVGFSYSSQGAGMGYSDILLIPCQVQLWPACRPREDATPERGSLYDNFISSQ